MNVTNRKALARKCVRGLSIGDAFGESFFGREAEMLNHIAQRRIPATSWEFTDDTVMAIAVLEELECYGTVQSNRLAAAFAHKHELDVNRGYGATTRRILRAITAGEDWQELARKVFSGMGSMGNGAAMRVGPIGAYYHDDFDRVRTLAITSAQITHTHIEGICGAIAVAIAVAMASRLGLKGKAMEPSPFIQGVLDWLPDCDTRSRIAKSLHVPLHYHTETLKRILGNGTQIQAVDTVPFALWCAAHHLDNLEEALWKAVSVLGDRDTIGAIVGAIVTMSTPADRIPTTWLLAVEDFEQSVFRSPD